MGIVWSLGRFTRLQPDNSITCTSILPNPRSIYSFKCTPVFFPPCGILASLHGKIFRPRRHQNLSIRCPSKTTLNAPKIKLGPVTPRFRIKCISRCGKTSRSWRPVAPFNISPYNIPTFSSTTYTCIVRQKFLTARVRRLSATHCAPGR